jgi:hypothetical protein
MKDIKLKADIISAQNGDEEAKNAVFSDLQFRFGYAIRRYLSKALPWDEAEGEGQLLLWGLIVKYDPAKCDNPVAYIASTWRHAANEIIVPILEGRSRFTVTHFDETFGDMLPNDLLNPETIVLGGEEKAYIQGFIDGLGLDPVDLAAILAYLGTENWREPTGDRKRFTPGAAASQVFEDNGIELTPIAASGRVRTIINQMKKEGQNVCFASN